MTALPNWRNMTTMRFFPSEAARCGALMPWLVSWWLLATSWPPHASFLSDGARATAADVLCLVVIVVTITVFWLVHILREKAAEKRQHPQAKAALFHRRSVRFAERIELHLALGSGFKPVTK